MRLPWRREEADREGAGPRAGQPWWVWVGEALILTWTCYTLFLYYREQGFWQLLKQMVLE